MRLAWVAAGLLLAAGAGCTCSPEVFHRMVTQRKYLPYQQNELFPDGRAMRPPPAGTVPREWLRRAAVPASGFTADGSFLARIPVEVTPALMARGQQRFEIVCATCHGLLGDGESMVARNMSLRPPPSLHALPDRPVGWYFDRISEGVGLMPAYKHEVSAEDRWAIVAYVLALQRSRRATLEQAPPDVRARLTGRAP
jgi:mono/diheme cytochrome c family protein